MKVDVSTSCILDGAAALYRVENFMNNNEAFKYVTGLGNYEHIKFVYGVLGLAVTQLKYKSTKLVRPDEFFLTLMKLPLATEDFALSLDFGISRFVVAQIVGT